MRSERFQQKVDKAVSHEREHGNTAGQAGWRKGPLDDKAVGVFID